ncbi:MAG: SDR family oxidoreductase, partial [Silvanigrellaceae bacterium]|nr:SDR family oxidoreductase [Silvanigrellaceae bacterium]
NEGKLNSLKTKLLEKYRGDFRCLLFDYESIDSIHVLAKSIEEPIDGLVIIPKRPAMPSSEIPSPELWNVTFNQCFIAPLEFIRVLSTQLKAESSLVVISGISSVYFVPAYANSNLLRVMWTAEVKNLSRQLANKHIRVNEISPAVILTEYSIGKIEEKAQLAQRTYEEQLALDAKETPLQRLGKPSDVANLVEFLLSDNSRHINGSNIVLDGGLNCSY